MRSNDENALSNPPVEFIPKLSKSYYFSFDIKNSYFFTDSLLRYEKDPIVLLNLFWFGEFWEYLESWIFGEDPLVIVELKFEYWENDFVFTEPYVTLGFDIWIFLKPFLSYYLCEIGED